MKTPHITPEQATDGTKVVVIQDDKTPFFTQVRAAYDDGRGAWKLGHGAWVVKVEGIVGGYSIERIFLAPEETE